MALKKEIILDNGVPTNYHRVVSINKITNVGNIIEVASYTSEEKREEERTYYESKKTDKSMNVFTNTEYISKEYDENEGIQEIYEYLKTLDKYKNAENA